MMKPQWVINIDIEGFSKLYPQGSQALKILGSLIDGIYKIGKTVFFDEKDRLFAYQSGDGFFIVSNDHEDSLDRPINIAICLLRYVLANGGMGKAVIAEGMVADVQCCYPDLVRNTDKTGDSLHMGEGLMTIWPIMGEGIINAFGLSKSAPSGSILLVENSKKQRISYPYGFIENLRVRAGANSSVSCSGIDWLKCKNPEVDKILSDSGLGLVDEHKRIALVREYIANHHHSLSSAWRHNTEQLLIS